MSDGYFHGAEANHIAMVGVLIGLDPVNIINHIATNYAWCNIWSFIRICYII